jgi:hypothetical protein
MGLLDKIGEGLTSMLFVQEDEQTSQKETEQDKGPQAAKRTIEPKMDAAAGQGPADATAGSQAMDKYRKALLDSLKKGKASGDIICLPFMKTLKSLESTIKEESVRFNVAFTSGESFGINTVSVIASCQSLKAALSQEELKFNQTLEREAVSKVKQEEGEVKEIEKLLAEKNANIQQLMKEVESLKVEKDSKIGEINEARIKIEATKRDFTQASQSLLNEFDEVIQKVNIYGGPTNGSK